MTKTVSRAFARRSLPFDHGFARGVSIYVRRAIIVAAMASIVGVVGLVYVAYRQLTAGVPWWPQLLVAVTIGYVGYVARRWVLARDLPTGFDQLVGLLLFVLCLPVYVVGALYLVLSPAMFRRVDLVGARGRKITAVEYRPASVDQPVGAYAPDAFAFISLLPHMIVGRVRFRGRPLVRLDVFTASGPIALQQLGRPPGIFPAHTGGPGNLDDHATARTQKLWSRVSSPPPDPRDAVLVIYLVTVAVKGPRARTCQVLLPFVVAANDESAVRARVLKLGGLDDLLLGHVSHTEALLRAAWIAWGEHRGSAGASRSAFVPSKSPSAERKPSRA